MRPSLAARAAIAVHGSASRSKCQPLRNTSTGEETHFEERLARGTTVPTTTVPGTTVSSTTVSRMAESKASVVDHTKGKIEVSVTRKYRSFQELGRHQLRFQIGESAGGDPAWISFKKFKDAKDGSLIPTFEICIESSQGACRLKDRDEMPRPWSCNEKLYAETALNHCKDGARHGIVVYHMIVTAVSELLAEQLLERPPCCNIYLSGHHEPLTDFEVLRHIHHVLTTRDAETTKSTKPKKRAKSEADDEESGVAKKAKIEDDVQNEGVKNQCDLGGVSEHAQVVNDAAKHGEGETLKPAKEEP